MLEHGTAENSPRNIPFTRPLIARPTDQTAHGICPSALLKGPFDPASRIFGNMQLLTPYYWRIQSVRFDQRIVRSQHSATFLRTHPKL